MDNLGIAAVSGLRSRMVSLDMLANNIANAASSGYKGDREFYGVFSSDDSSNSVDGAGSTTLPVVQHQWTDFSPGVMQVTGNPLDIAVDGKGFFSIQGPKGTLYTRNGNLRVLPSGELGTADGYPLLGAGASPIHVSANKPITIGLDGTVSQGTEKVGQIQVVDFKSTDGLQKVGSAGFENTTPAVIPTPAANSQIQQGKLEGSNVAVSEAAMRLVGIMRQSEMLQKAIGLSGEMDSKSIQEVARVGA